MKEKTQEEVKQERRMRFWLITIVIMIFFAPPIVTCVEITTIGVSLLISEGFGMEAPSYTPVITIVSGTLSFLGVLAVRGIFKNGLPKERKRSDQERVMEIWMEFSWACTGATFGAVLCISSAATLSQLGIIATIFPDFAQIRFEQAIPALLIGILSIPVSLAVTIKWLIVKAPIWLDDLKELSEGGREG